MSAYDHIRIERQGPVGWLLNARPESDNAMNRAMADEIAVAWRELAADRDVRVIVHTGVGNDFSVGADVDDPASEGNGRRQFDATYPPVWKPVIAAVNGNCAGEALRFIAGADVVIAASDAHFYDPQVTLGNASLEAVALIKRIPAEAVMRMAFMGAHERIDALRALEIGLISEVVDPPAELRDRAQVLAETIARNSPAATAATKKALWGAFDLGLTDACRAGAAHLVSLWGHADQAEGPRAFAEKRAPVWLELEGETR
ncbi:MAG: enoyl-CoA hydratase/isomerase family protein [Acidimicrobiia bacterium]